MKNLKKIAIMFVCMFILTSGTITAKMTDSSQPIMPEVGIEQHEEMLAKDARKKMVKANKELIENLERNKAVASIDFHYPELKESLCEYEKSIDAVISLLKKINAEANKEIPNRIKIISMQMDLQETVLASIEIFDDMTVRKQQLKKRDVETVETIRGSASPPEKTFKSNLEY